MNQFNLLKIITFVFLTTTGNISFGDELSCDNSNKIVSNFSSQAKVLSPEFIDRISKSNSNVVLLGEHHLHQLKPFYSWLLEDLRNKDQGFECLVLEANKNKEEENVSSHVRAFKATGLSKGYKVYFVDDSAEIPHRFKISSRKLKKLAEENPQKYQDLMVDMFDWALEDSHHRNSFISKEIGGLVATGECKKIIGIFGSGHLTRSKHPKHPTPIQEQLINQSNAPLQTYTVLLEETKTALAGISSLGHTATISKILSNAENVWNKCSINSKYEKNIFLMDELDQEEYGPTSTLYIPQGFTF